MRRYFKTDNNSAYVSEWKSKGLSNEGIKSPKVGNNNLSPQINYYEHHLRVIFSGSKISSSNINDYLLQNCLLGSVTLTRNADIDNYKYSGYGIGFDRKGSFSSSGGEFGQNVIIFVQI